MTVAAEPTSSAFIKRKVQQALDKVAERAKFAAAAWSALAVGAVTAAAGPIGFVGLVGPHLARLLVGPGHALLGRGGHRRRA
mgnify:CR=1 FL=1